MTLASSDWLAGFVDGEGSFTLNVALRPRLAIELRLDDLELLERIAAEFGGSIHVRSRPSFPSASWSGASKRTLAALVRYFDEHPLQSKKHRDYAIWRRAALIYCAHGARAPELPDLKAALVAVRAFDGDGEVPEDVESAQLSLIAGGRS